MDHTDFSSKVVGVFFGSKSPEHDISVVTGTLVIQELEKLGIATELVYIATDGSWCLGRQLRDKQFVESIHSHDLYDLQRWSIDTRHRTPQLILTRRPSFFARREKKQIDIVFPALHGAYGEDGTLQGLCELLGVPYVGSGIEGSAIAMNKALTKHFFRELGVPTTEFLSFETHEWEKKPQNIIDAIDTDLRYPLFVKPAHAGSSIGITRVKAKNALRDAIELAFSFDTHCVAENGVSPIRDLTCCLREVDGDVQASLIQDSSFGDSDFFTYQAKYLQDGGAQFGSATRRLQIPADIPEHIAESIRTMSIRIFKELGLSGIGRVDFLYNSETGDLYANEINPMPGTLYHHLWEKSGVELKELLTCLLASAQRKYHFSIRKNRYFASPLLKDLKKGKLAKAGDTTNH